VGFVQQSTRPGLPLAPHSHRKGAASKQATTHLPRNPEEARSALLADFGDLHHLCSKGEVPAVPHQFMPELFHVTVLTVMLIVSYKP